MTTTYLTRRGQIETYFDRTAAEAWKRFTSDAPVSGIRATVRAGRDRMRTTLLSWLPEDLTGRLLLDAGCGTGALAVEAARRGAQVTAIDLSPTLIDLARDRAPKNLQIDFRAGDMSDPALGTFDHIVCMDSVIHYEAPDMARVVASLAARATTSLLFTYAPRTPLLTVMHAAGRLLPRSDRAPSIEPVTPTRIRTLLQKDPTMAPWQPGRSERINASFYISQAQELVRAMRKEIPAWTIHGLALAARRLNQGAGAKWGNLTPAFLPFADAGTAELPMLRLLRLSLFQVTVGMAVVLLIGTLNRVMIVELGVPAWLVATMVALPLVFAPFRAVVGFRSDTHRSVLGWKRVPYLWFGTLLQFGGLSIMPFALIVLSGDAHGPLWIGQAAAGLAFLLVGAGMHTTQTVGLALATDLATPEKQPKVVALLCMMLLLGMVASALIFGLLLSPFSEVKLIQVVQGSAVVTMVLNAVALWKQEARNPALTAYTGPRPRFLDTWRVFARDDLARRRLVALAIGTVAFSMQDILLEPFGGHVLGLPVAATTAMTALLAIGGLIGFGIGARLLGQGADPYRLSGSGVLAGLAAFTALLFSAPLAAPGLFAIGVAGIGLGAGLFAHCTLTAAMASAGRSQIGLVLGVWGAVQASAAGCAVAAGGLIRDAVGALAERGAFGPTLATPATGYLAVYAIEIVLLFATLIAVGPLVRVQRSDYRLIASPQPSNR